MIWKRILVELADRGCIPSKALLHVAKLIDESRHAKNWGIEYADPKIDSSRLRSWKGRGPKADRRPGTTSKQRKVEYIQGRAAFENSNTLRISKAGGGEESRTFDCIPPPVRGRRLFRVRVWFTRPALDLKLNAAGGRRRLHLWPGSWARRTQRRGEGFGGPVAAGRRPRPGTAVAQADRVSAADSDTWP